MFATFCEYLVKAEDFTRREIIVSYAGSFFPAWSGALFAEQQGNFSFGENYSTAGFWDYERESKQNAFYLDE